MKTDADTVERLPPGRHGIAPEVVVENQRKRILAAVCQTHRELGYPAMSVGEIATRAGVSTATFYKLFDNKAESVVTAQQEVAEALREEILRGWSLSQEWPDQVSEAIGAALLFVARAPAQVLLLLSDSVVGEPELTRVPLLFQSFLVELLSSARARAPEAASIPELTEQAQVGAVRALIASHLLTGLEADLPAMRPELTQFLLTPYLGQGEAERVAGRSH